MYTINVSHLTFIQIENSSNRVLTDLNLQIKENLLYHRSFGLWESTLLIILAGLLLPDTEGFSLKARPNGPGTERYCISTLLPLHG